MPSIAILLCNLVSFSIPNVSFGSDFTEILRPNAEGTYSEFPNVYPQTIDYLYVDGMNDVRDWSKSGSSPYLDAIDGSKVYTKIDEAEVGDFSFDDSARSEPILKVYIQLYSYQEGDGEMVYVWLYYDGEWNNVGAITPALIEMGYTWREIDVSSQLDSWSKINNCQMYLEYYWGAGPRDIIHVDCARFEVEVSIHYDKVDEEISDEDESYIRTSTSTLLQKKDTFNLSGFSLPEDNVINWVRVYCRVRSEDVINGSCKTMIRTYSTDYFGSQVEPDTSYQNIYTEYTVNPYTEDVWTEDEINALEGGIQGWSGDLFGMYYPMRCTQVWVSINFSVAEISISILFIGMAFFFFVIILVIIYGVKRK